MAAPATSGRLVTTLTGMNIGDYIACQYVVSTSGSVGTFSNLGGTVGTEIPVSGSATPNGWFYFIKVDRGLLIADRPVQSNITWDTLNTTKFIQGESWNSGYIRSLTGGCSYADSDGNLSYSASSSNYGNYPQNNEWDKYIVKSNLGGKITAHDDNVWHYLSVYSWCQDTPINGTFTPVTGTTATASSSNRMARGTNNSSWNDFSFAPTTVTTASYCFRPVFQYIE